MLRQNQPRKPTLPRSQTSPHNRLPRPFRHLASRQVGLGRGLQLLVQTQRGVRRPHPALVREYAAFAQNAAGAPMGGLWNQEKECQYFCVFGWWREDWVGSRGGSGKERYRLFAVHQVCWRAVEFGPVRLMLRGTYLPTYLLSYYSSTVWPEIWS